jgi:hypothetical protein
MDIDPAHAAGAGHKIAVAERVRGPAYDDVFPSDLERVEIAADDLA